MILTHVHKDPILLLGGEGDGDVGAGHHVQRLQLHVRRVVAETEQKHICTIGTKIQLGQHTYILFKYRMAFLVFKAYVQEFISWTHALGLCTGFHITELMV